MRVTVVSPHKSNYPDPIGFVPGDVVSVGKEDSQYPGWIRVKTADGNEGWAPQVYIRKTSDVSALAVSEYTARELDTTKGESLTVHFELNGWIWVENDRGESGWVPRETVV